LQRIPDTQSPCLLLAAEPTAALVYIEGYTPLTAALLEQHAEAARCLLAEGPLPLLQHPEQLLELLADWEGEAARPLYPILAARQSLTPQQWGQVPSSCPGLGAALPAVLERSAQEAAHLVRHLPPADRQRLSTAALCLARAQR